ncbi:MAG: DNA methyltransferase [Paraglaciecola polaris]|uniref:Eco57I restriction-modification methylase domain-containing protein n=1 Tax=Paraglaciecola polaris TaxID=222814 RepID=UPI00300396E1|tara:strand:+ start:6477 stop:9857 length:3381 start_codon:yes stop_codon:yes gene_type:complete
MRAALEKSLRSKLEKTVEKARDIVEVAVAEALTRLGVSDGNAPNYLSETDRKLRTRLRAHGRQLGDVLNKDSGKQETELLINEMAYEHWHRMLFARFLEQSDLLMYEPGTHVTLDECFELAEEEDDCKDGWELAGQLAQKMLPQIFRADSPVFEVKLSINHVNDLEELIAALHLDTFQASDALGWCYQFWQNKKKKQVNESGVRIGAKELSPVTQLFTEPYMVSFLLDNALGAWWAKRCLTSDDLQTATSEQELRELAAIPGVPLEYLRFVQDEVTKAWSNAADDFDKWPEHLSELKTLDPCCGSGHFLVATFLMLVPMRMKLEALTEKQAIEKVLSENIHGLELDQRCVELAAFALALEAWRYPGAGGYRQLPELQLACSGMSINEAQKEWKDLAKGNEELQSAVKWMQQTFKDASILGSLIEPLENIKSNEIRPWDIIERAITNASEINNETVVISKGLITAANLLTNKYSWVTTNVPFRQMEDCCPELRTFSKYYYPESKTDLSTVFQSRILKLLSKNGKSSSVIPQSFLYKDYYAKYREVLFRKNSVSLIARLGAYAFREITGEEVKVALTIITPTLPNESQNLLQLDVSQLDIEQKESELSRIKSISIPQRKSLITAKNIVATSNEPQGILLEDVCTFSNGVQTGDYPRFGRNVWEILNYEGWGFQLTTVDETQFFSGRSKCIFWGNRDLVQFVEEKLGEGKAGSWIRGTHLGDSKGVAISAMGDVKATLYQGEVFDDNTVVIIPNDEKELLSVWETCSSKAYNSKVRIVDQSSKVRGALLRVALESSGDCYNLPSMFTNDLTQWIFHGHPSASVTWSEETKTTSIGDLRQDDTVLQVAVARLLGYQWPAELDIDMELAPEMREVLAKCKDFDGLVDDDGIVCIPAIRGEKPATDRLESILHAAYGDEWSATVLNNLLKSVKSKNLSTWLRDKFFEQHCKLFQHRPFIWHIWDGLADGFSALVNYHTLDYKGLERLIYTYLDDWISTQIQLEKDGVEGAELRLTAARNLKESLEAILVGEKGLDIFVRWKSLAEQPIGWNPDLNDGVRLNIRPFIQAKDVGKKEAGVLRSKPNIHWKKDRGTDVASAPWFDLGLECGGKQGDRINDHHLTLAEKKAAREAQ